MSKSTPAPPDYTAAAEATAESGQQQLTQQTYANRPNQFTPFGSTTWEAGTTIDPATGQEVTSWEQYSQLNPESQRALDAQLKLTADKSELASGMYGRMEDEFSQPMDWSSLPEVGTGAGARDRAETAIYDRSASRLDPQWEQRTAQKEAQLAARGLRPGDKAYDQAMENMGRERTDAYQQATYGSIMGGGQEADRQYNLESSDRNRQLAEQMQQRGFSLNEINAIISGQQVGMPDMPGFNQAGKSAGTDYSGAAGAQYGASMDAFNAEQAMMNSLMQGAGMGASALMMSDRRLKRHIERIGSYLGYPWYVFQYVWGQWAVGVMADEVNEDAVVMLPNGYAAVDYARIK